MCALFRTYCQVLAGFGRGADSVPVLADQRGRVGRQFLGGDQHDVFEFLEHFLDRARVWEIEARRCSGWGGVQLTTPVATHVERLFGFVRETRRRCRVCKEMGRAQVRSWFSSENVLHVAPQGGRRWAAHGHGDVLGVVCCGGRRVLVWRVWSEHGT